MLGRYSSYSLLENTWSFTLVDLDGAVHKATPEISIPKIDLASGCTAIAMKYPSDVDDLKDVDTPYRS